MHGLNAQTNGKWGGGGGQRIGTSKVRCAPTIDDVRISWRVTLAGNCFNNTFTFWATLSAPHPNQHKDCMLEKIFRSFWASAWCQRRTIEAISARRVDNTLRENCAILITYCVLFSSKATCGVTCNVYAGVDKRYFIYYKEHQSKIIKFELIS